MAVETADRIARAFVDARRSAQGIAVYPGPRPGSLDSAYDIQDHALRLWGDRSIGGWKVGRIAPPMDALLGANRLAGPIFSETIAEDFQPAASVMPIFPDGFAACEAEFMLRLTPRGQELPRTDAETLAWVDDIRIGIEIASSPYANINADGPCVTVSDHGNNAGLVLGTAVPRSAWNALPDIEVTAMIDGTEVGCDRAANMLDGPLGAVRFLLGHLQQRGLPIVGGTWISSGAVTGVHEIRQDQTFHAVFGEFGTVQCGVSQ